MHLGTHRRAKKANLAQAGKGKLEGAQVGKETLKAKAMSTLRQDHISQARSPRRHETPLNGS